MRLQYGTLDVKLTQMVAETKENNSCHSDEEAGFCQSLIDHAHHIFKVTTITLSSYTCLYCSGLLWTGGVILAHFLRLVHRRTHVGFSLCRTFLNSRAGIQVVFWKAVLQKEVKRITWKIIR